MIFRTEFNGDRELEKQQDEHWNANCTCGTHLEPCLLHKDETQFDD